MKSVKATSATTSSSQAIRAAAKKKQPAPVKKSAKKTAINAISGKQDFSVHLVVPEGAGIDSKNIKVTRKGLQLVIELQSGGGEASNQVEGVKKVPVPPRPHFPVDDVLDRLAFKLTLSKKAVR